MEALRAQVLLHYRGRTISADDVHGLIDHAPALRIPDGMSPNCMGTFFSTWDRAEKVGMIRSVRDGSNGNLIFTWRIW
jgi:hypothetical protein